ncbi:MAG: hypothetical protein JEZ04_22315 [Spirochaetales bacterium]|nr:hypothetical protein [Spirochaetales bacterium]
MIERPEIEEYLPHKDSMLLLDRIMDYDTENNFLVSEVDTGDDDLFFNAELNGIPAWTGFEYMAQSIAALSGVNARTLLGIEPKIGFIMSIRAFNTEIPAFPCGKTLQVRVSQIFNENSVVSFDCSIMLDSRIVTTAIVNAIEIDSVSEFLEN